jgi:hypothetical protein
MLEISQGVSMLIIKNFWPVHYDCACRDHRLLPAVSLVEENASQGPLSTLPFPLLHSRGFFRCTRMRQGRVYAAYGGVYISVALCWLWLVDSIRPSFWDIVRVIVSLTGMAIIMFAPRHA